MGSPPEPLLRVSVFEAEYMTHADVPVSQTRAFISDHLHTLRILSEVLRLNPRPVRISPIFSHARRCLLHGLNLGKIVTVPE